MDTMISILIYIIVCLQTAFMFIEMAFIQKFILYLDQPAYAFSAVLFCVLFFSGLGSRFGASKIPLKTSLLILLACLGLYVGLLSSILSATLGSHFVLRLGISILVIAPYKAEETGKPENRIDGLAHRIAQVERKTMINDLLNSGIYVLDWNIEEQFINSLSQNLERINIWNRLIRGNA